MVMLQAEGAQRVVGTAAPLRSVLVRFCRQRMGVLSVLLLILITGAAFIGPLVWHYNYADITGDVLVSPSLKHPLGTDQIGHDLLAQLFVATQTTLEIASIVAVTSTTVGTIAGLVAGYFGGWVDATLMRIVDLLFTIPLLVVVGLVAVRFAASSWSPIIIALAVSSLFWTAVARVIRGVAFSLRRREFVDSARIAGASSRRILLRYLLPHVLGPITVIVTTSVAAAVSLETSLSFLGLGVQPPHTSLGLLIENGIGLTESAPWLFFVPSGVVVGIVLSVHFAGDALRRALDMSDAAVVRR